MFSIFKRNNNTALDIKHIDDKLGSINLIDVREKYEFQGSSIRTAKNIPMGELLTQPARYLKKEDKYYIMCQSGARSYRTVSALRRAGYDVVNVSGGMSSYRGNNIIIGG